MSYTNNKSIVLFDGVCHLCQKSVRFIIKHDKKNNFLFASLQGETSKHLLQGYDISKKQTLFLIEENKVFVESTAAMRIVRQLRFPINVLYVFNFIPKFLRDAVYRFVSRNRYRWFGKDNECMMPSPSLRERFLD
jgi:predicted DCC family thiol-disulfide oxidoreductase YuxK